MFISRGGEGVKGTHPTGYKPVFIWCARYGIRNLDEMMDEIFSRYSNPKQAVLGRSKIADSMAWDVELV